MLFASLLPSERESALTELADIMRQLPESPRSQPNYEYERTAVLKPGAA